MTSKQVMLTAALAALVALGGGCESLDRFNRKPGGLTSPYTTRRVWAVAPLRNESGSLRADGYRMADHLARQLEQAPNIDVLAVNRTLAAMEATSLPAVRTPAEALGLMRTLGADALVVGTITAFDPYDPPKLGLAIELYVNEALDRRDAMNVRRLSRAATDDHSRPDLSAGVDQPVTVVSSFLDAGHPHIRRMLERYAAKRGPVEQEATWHRYRISMDLYSEFAGYVMSWRLLEAERARIAPPPVASADRP